MNLKDWQFDKDHVKSWAEEGKKAGIFAREVFSTAESSVMQMLLTVAAIIAGTPSAEDFLTGYANAWDNADTAKSRKTDARAVLEAYGLKDAEGKSLMVERIVDYEKDEKGEYKKDERKLLIPIQETKSAQDWLKGYKGDFKGFLALARELRAGTTARDSRGTTVNRKRNVTEKQFGAIMEALPVANLNQAHTIVAEATKQIARMPGFEVALLNEMEQLCNILKTSSQPIFAEAASKMFDVLNELREEVRKAQAAAARAKADLAGPVQGDIQAPAPAAKQPKAA